MTHAGGKGQHGGAGAGHLQVGRSWWARQILGAVGAVGLPRPAAVPWLLHGAGSADAGEELWWASMQLTSLPLPFHQWENLSRSFFAEFLLSLPWALVTVCTGLSDSPLGPARCCPHTRVLRHTMGELVAGDML